MTDQHLNIAAQLLTDFLHEALPLRQYGRILSRGKLTKQLLLLLVQPLGYFDQYLHQFIAQSLAAKIRQTLAAKLEYLAMLCAGGHFQLLRSVERRHFDTRSQRSLRKRDGNLADKVV